MTAAPDFSLPSVDGRPLGLAELRARTEPRARVLTLFFFFFITWFELPASIVLLAWFGLQLVSGVGQLGTHVSGGVAYWAHVGGFAFGALVAWFFYRNRRRPRPTMSGVPRSPGDPG